MIAESDEDLRVPADCLDVQAVDDPLGAVAAAGSEHVPHPGQRKASLRLADRSVSVPAR
jgi:hypothetical protein